MKLENPLVFYPRHWFKTARGIAKYLATFARLHLKLRSILADPESVNYRDAAITPARAEDTGDRLVEATRVTDYARRRMTNGVKSQAPA
jgi:hypothetical protein